MRTIFQWCPVTERHTGPMALFPFYLGKCLVGQLAKVRTIRYALAYQLVCALVCVPFSGK